MYPWAHPLWKEMWREISKIALQKYRHCKVNSFVWCVCVVDKAFKQVQVEHTRQLSERRAFLRSPGLDGNILATRLTLAGGCPEGSGWARCGRWRRCWSHFPCRPGPPGRPRIWETVFPARRFLKGEHIHAVEFTVIIIIIIIIIFYFSALFKTPKDTLACAIVHFFSQHPNTWEWCAGHGTFHNFFPP